MSEFVKPKEIPSYTQMTGEIYDLIYADKDYAGQAAKLAELIEQYSESGGNLILEAACGTGTYMHFLKDRFAIDGFDLSAGQVAAAKKKNPDACIVQADMLDFDMGQTYDAVVCLFSSIGYLKTKENLDKAIANMAKHTKPGGLVIIEPWLKDKDYQAGHISVESNSNDTLFVSRMGISYKDGNVSRMDMHHMVGTSNGIEHFVETHELAMYTDEDFADAFTKVGLGLEIEPEGLTGRGLYIGKKPLS
jgi:SAM-dependent methyltransferase